MGEAKRRGTFGQRKAEAIKHNNIVESIADADIVVMNNEIVVIDKDAAKLQAERLIKALNNNTYMMPFKLQR